MPKPTLEILRTREAALRGRLAGEGLAAERRRAIRKRLRRTQRKRRRLVTRIARMAPKKAEPAGS